MTSIQSKLLKYICVNNLKGNWIKTSLENSRFWLSAQCSIYMKKGLLDEAQKVIDSMLKLGYSSMYLRYSEAKIQSLKRNHINAIKKISKLHDEFPNSTYILNARDEFVQIYKMYLMNK